MLIGILAHLTGKYLSLGKKIQPMKGMVHMTESNDGSTSAQIIGIGFHSFRGFEFGLAKPSLLPINACVSGNMK